MGADGLKTRQGLGVVIDRALKLCAAIAERLRLQEDGRDAGIDQGRLEGADVRHLQIVDHVAGWEHCPPIVAVLSRVHEFQLDLGGREGDAVELEIAGFLHGAGGHRHMGNDRLADISLPDTHNGNAIGGHARRIDQAVADGERPDRRRQVAAIAAPVDKGCIDRYLAEQVVDIVVRPLAFRQDHRLRRRRGRSAHAVDLLAIRVRAADDAHQEPVARRTRHTRGLRQVVPLEEHALAGAAAHIGGRDADLRGEGHGFTPRHKPHAKKWSPLFG